MMLCKQRRNGQAHISCTGNCNFHILALLYLSYPPQYNFIYLREKPRYPLRLTSDYHNVRKMATIFALQLHTKAA